MARRNRVTPLSELVADPRAGWSTATAAACTTPPGRSAAATRAGAGSPAGCASAAGTARRCCNPGASRSSSSSTRRPPWPPVTAPARCAGARTTTAWSRCGATCTPGRSAPTHGRPAARRARRGGHTRPAPSRRAARRPARRDVPPARRRAVARARRRAPGVDAGRLRSRGSRGRRRGRTVVITPPSLVAVLRSGWQGVVPRAPVGGTLRRLRAGDDGDQPVARRLGLLLGRRLDHHAHERLGAAGAHAARARAPRAPSPRARPPRPARRWRHRRVAVGHAHVDEPLRQLLHRVASARSPPVAAPRASAARRRSRRRWGRSPCR